MINALVEEVEVNNKPEYSIRFHESEFRNVSFKYGEVKFLEDDKKESATLAFEYDIIEGELPPADKLEAFEKLAGDYLLQMIEQQLLQRDLVFKGGTEEE